MESQDLGGVSARVLQDPIGNSLWLIRYSEESPNRIGELTPGDE
jgi:hypothetical protein